MRKIPLTIEDTYEIVAISIFHEYDRKILVRLYQPIIGYESTILYFNLWSELEGDLMLTRFEKKHERLISMMQCSIQTVEESLLRLEAIGLVQTYMQQTQEGRRFVYFLRSPKSPKNFYSTDVMDVLLKRALGSYEYDRTRQYFSNAFRLEKEFQEITVPFSEVFHLSDINPTFDSKRRKNDTIIDYAQGELVLNFDFEALQEKLDRYQFSLKVLGTEEKEAIANVGIAYDLSMVDLCTAILNASKNNHTCIDVAKLRANARSLSELSSIKKIEPEKVASPILKTGNKLYDKKLALYNEVSPIAFMQLLNKDQPVLDADAYTIAELKKKTPLSDAVINVIIDYTVQQNDYRFPKAYVQKIASSLVRAGKTEDAYEAMLYLNQEVSNYIRPSSNQSKNSTSLEVNDQDVKNAFAELNKIREKVKKDGKA